MKNFKVKANIALGMIILSVIPCAIFIFMAFSGDVELNKTLSLVGAVYLVAAFIFSLLIAMSVDKTIQSAKEQIKGLVKSITLGKLDQRADSEEAGKDFKELISDTNNLIDAFTAPFNVSAEYIDRISKGDLPAKITDEYHGDFNEIKNNLNICIDAIQALVDEADNLSNSAINGRIRVRGNADKHGGEFRNIITGVNNTLDSLVGIMDKLPLPIMGISNEYEVLYMNDLGAKVGNKSPNQVEGTKCYEHFRTSDCNTDKCACHKAMASNAVASSETDAHPGNLDLEINYSGFPILNQAGAVVGAYEAVVDQTAVKRAMATAEKVASYQNNEANKLVEGLGLMAEGELNFMLEADEADEDTGSVKATFDKIYGAVSQSIGSVRKLADDATMLAAAAAEGKLDTRADADQHKGAYKEIINGVNSTLDNVIGPLNVAAEYVDRISKGDIPPEITDEYRGDFNEIKNNLNVCIGAIHTLVSDAAMLSEAAADGKLDTRADASKHGGDFRAIVEGVNSTLDNVIGPLNVAAEYVDRISKGDIPPEITDEYKGDFNEIKNNLNVCIGAVNSLVEDANILANAAIVGRVRTRSDASKHGGDFRKIIEGVNSALDSLVGIMDNLPLPIMGISSDFEVLYMNELGAKVGNKSPNQVEGTKCFEHFRTSDCNTGNCACHKAMATNAVASSETDAHPGNLDLEISYSGIPIHDAEGNIVGAYEAVVDQTQVKQAMATAEKVANYQNNEANKLVEGLGLMAEGELNFSLDTDEADADTGAVKDTFEKIYGAVGRSISSVRELADDANMLSEAAAEGKLDTRADAAKHKGAYKNIIEGVNNTLDNVIGPLNVAAEYVDRISKGDIPPEITDEYKGDFNEIKNNLNTCINAIQALVADAGMLSEAAAEGKLDTRADASKHGGDFRAIVEGVNNTLDNVIGPLNVAAEYVDRISKGDIPPEITDEYKGDFNEIKNNLNVCINAINSLVEDAKMLSNEAVKGKIRSRGDASKHGGDFRKIIEGVNNTLDAMVGILDGLPLPIMGITSDYDVLYMNEIGAKVGNKTPGQVEGGKCYDHFRTSDCKTENCACSKAMKADAQASSETDAHPGDLDLEINYSGFPIHDDEGNVVGAYEAVVDQTEIKKAMNLQSKIAGYQQNETDKLVGALEELAEGNFKVHIDLEEPDSDTAEAHNTLERILEAVRKFTASVFELQNDCLMLADAADNGQLDTRADVSKHKGDFQDIVTGINNIIDNILAPLTDAIDKLSIMSTGDLTARMTKEYKGDYNELKNSINSLGDSLCTLIGQVSDLANSVSSIAVQMTSSAETMAAGAQEQSAQADDVASAVEEMSRTVTENAMSAGRTAEEAENNGKIANEGGQVVEQTVIKMRDIAGVVSQSAQNMEKLGESSQKIGEIISVIDDIADQTNLLALNAAIEAARAGEQGRGFAVVADEVRKLAERTTEATKQIADMIKGIQSETQNAVTVMTQGNEEVTNGISLADQAGNSLKEIVTSTQHLLDMINQIAAASEEQSSTTEQISKNVAAISQVSGDTATQINDIAGSADELSKMVTELAEQVNRFKVSGEQDYDYSNEKVLSNGHGNGHLLEA